jgi:hypothetical protein
LEKNILDIKPQELKPQEIQGKIDALEEVSNGLTKLRENTHPLLKFEETHLAGRKGLGSGEETGCR